MSKITNILANFTNDPKLANLTPEINKKIHDLTLSDKKDIDLAFIIEILAYADSVQLYLPDIFDVIFDNIEELFLLNTTQIKTTLDSILFWQDWKTGIKFIEKIQYNIHLTGEQWLLLADFSFKLGSLCYNLFKGSNYALTLLFFEKTLNYLSKSTNERKTLLILSATVWFIGQIEFEKGYSIKASDYQLSSIYYQKNFSNDEFENFFSLSRTETRNALILSTFQGATDFFIASKVAAQSFQNEFSKNFLYHSYLFINRILRLIDNEKDYVILSQIRTFLLQLHSVIDKEGFMLNHSCDSNTLSSSILDTEEFMKYVDSHVSLLEDRDKKVFWLAVLDQGGIVLFEYDFEKNSLSSKNTLYSSFIHVISKWGQVELESGPARELNFLGNSFIIEVIDGIEIIAVVSKPSPEFRFAVKNFASNFNKSFAEELKEWNGNVKMFESKGLELVENLKKNITP